MKQGNGIGLSLQSSDRSFRELRRRKQLMRAIKCFLLIAMSFPELLFARIAVHHVNMTKKLVLYKNQNILLNKIIWNIYCIAYIVTITFHLIKSTQRSFIKNLQNSFFALNKIQEMYRDRDDILYCSKKETGIGPVDDIYCAFRQMLCNLSLTIYSRKY